jgi:excisionase family DNA binding protein
MCLEAPVDKMSMPAIMKTRDLAILLDLSPDTVNDMARRGILKGFKNGNQWRFRRKDVERYIERGKKAAALSPVS